MESTLTTSKLFKILPVDLFKNSQVILASVSLLSLLGQSFLSNAQPGPKFLGASLSAGWNSEQIEVVVYQYTNEELKTQKTTTAEIYSLNSNVLYTSLELKLEETRKVKHQLANPCTVDNDRPVYVNIYRGNAPPDRVGYDYKINWVSTAVDVDPISTERIMGKNIVLSCELPGNSKTDLAVIEYNKDPFFYLCLGNSVPQNLDVKSKIPTRNKVILQPIRTANLNESNMMLPDGEQLSNGPSLIEWKKDYDLNNPLGKNAIIIDETSGAMEFNPRIQGLFLLSEGITQDKSKLINTVRTYFIEVSQQ